METQNEMQTESIVEKKFDSVNKLSIPVAIIIAGVIVAGAILLKTNNSSIIPIDDNGKVATVLAPVGDNDMTLGNKNAKVTLILYEDFQCPFCSAINGPTVSNASLIKSLRQNDPSWTSFMPEIKNNYINKGKVLFVYRDFAFLGRESLRASESARCAGDQNKFWEYHDYLYSNQNGENQGNFSDQNLKSFAKNLGLNTSLFDKCLDESKYAQAIADYKNEAVTAGVTGTPKGFILVDGKVVSTIDGAESLSTVKPKIDNALK